MDEPVHHAALKPSLDAGNVPVNNHVPESEQLGRLFDEVDQGVLVAPEEPHALEELSGVYHNEMLVVVPPYHLLDKGHAFDAGHGVGRGECVESSPVLQRMDHGSPHVVGCRPHPPAAPIVVRDPVNRAQTARVIVECEVAPLARLLGERNLNGCAEDVAGVAGIEFR